MADNSEPQQPQAGVPQQRNEWVMRNPRNKNQGTYTRTDRDFDGSTPEIGGVLTLPAETYISIIVGCTKFRELLTNYLVKNFKESMEVENTIKTLRDPLDIFEKLNPTNLYNLPQNLFHSYQSRNHLLVNNPN